MSKENEKFKCPECNHHIAKVAKVCSNCGNKLTMSGFSTYLICAFLLLLVICFESIIESICLIFFFGLIFRLMKKRYDRKLGILNGKMVDWPYEETFFKELMKEKDELH